MSQILSLDQSFNLNLKPMFDLRFQLPVSQDGSNHVEFTGVT